jgi:uncharacterized membrane protein YfcA
MFRRSLLVIGFLSLCTPALAAGLAPSTGVEWWLWPVLLFSVCVVLGILAVPAGLGGGVLFVPIVGALFPFHLDFVRGAGLMVALASSLASSPKLLRLGFAHLGLALPISLVVAGSQIAGAYLGLMLAPNLVQLLLGASILTIVGLTALAGPQEFPSHSRTDALAAALHLNGIFRDPVRGVDRPWTAQRTATALLLFLLIGLMAGMFGLGAGWANVPILNLWMGVPLKISAGTSSLILSLTSSAAWVYINEGAVLPLIVVPSMLGMILGARLGVRLLQVMPALFVRRLVMLVLALAGGRAVLVGIKPWL